MDRERPDPPAAGAVRVRLAAAAVALLAGLAGLISAILLLKDALA